VILQESVTVVEAKFTLKDMVFKGKPAL